MLKVVDSLEPWVVSELVQFLEENTHQLHDFNAYYEDLIFFFEQDHGILFFWEENGAFVSSCRFEVEQDQYLLHDLITKNKERRKGYGKKLLLATIDYLKDQGIPSVFVHIKKNNTASLALHASVGFCKVKDTARLLDGSVSSSYMTMEYLIK